MVAGTLILVVGPSGAGKDTLLDGARLALADDPRFVFARRVITRPAGAGGEDHEPATEAVFAEHERRGDFLLSWRAHGLGYGLPGALADDLAVGRSVIANVSRSVIAEAAARYAPIAVIEVTAPLEIRAERLARRGRETAADVAQRLAREGAAAPEGVAVTTVVNDAGPDEGVARFLAAVAGMGAPCSA